MLVRTFGGKKMIFFPLWNQTSEWIYELYLFIVYECIGISKLKTLKNVDVNRKMKLDVNSNNVAINHYTQLLYFFFLFSSAWEMFDKWQEYRWTLQSVSMTFDSWIRCTNFDYANCLKLIAISNSHVAVW